MKTSARKVWILLPAVLVTYSACEIDDSDDTGLVGADVLEPADISGRDFGISDQGKDDFDGFDDSYDDIAGGWQGFEIRYPAESHAGLSAEVGDMDYICTFSPDDDQGFLYIQASPVSCSATGLCQFDTVGAWVSFNGVAQPVDARYNWGGHHHNDWIRLKWGEYTFKFYHSSFGFGWRSCQEPDCLVVETEFEVIQDGCEPERTLPVVCRLIQPDGTFDSFEDSFEPCAGDPRAVGDKKRD